jgi:hypothetical protein
MVRPAVAVDTVASKNADVFTRWSPAMVNAAVGVMCRRP